MIQVQLKLRPTKAQERTFERWLWHLTGVWNWAILKIGKDADAGRHWTLYDMKALLNGHSRRMGIHSNVLCGTVATAHLAWKRCFTGLSRPPRLKGRRRPLSSIAFTHTLTRPKGGRIGVPGIGQVRFHRQDIPDGHIGSARIVKRASGWYLCLFIHADPPALPVCGVDEVGIDPGFLSLLTLSTGEKIDHPHEWREREARLGQAQRGRRTRLAGRLQERIANQRKNRNHHISRRLVERHQLIAFSKDNVSAIARKFGKSVGSAAHSQLRSMLAYKSLAGGRQYIEVSNRNSTRACSACGALTGPTGWRALSVRQWVCSACGVDHDRDCNAAVNTLIAGRGARHERRREAVSGIAR